MAKLKAAVVLAAVVLTPSMATQARADDGAWCAYAGGRNDYENCSYYTLRQCLASVSGVGVACRPNPYFRGGYAEPYDDMPPPPRRRVRRY